jgi:hypothetical protein
MMEQFAGYHARALRAIGQDLADLLPENVTIEPAGDSFNAHGMCSRRRLENSESTGLRKIGIKLRAGIFKHPPGEPDLDLAPFVRNYDADVIDQLDEQGNRRRIGAGGMPAIYSLGERLRTIGKVIDGHNGQLIRIYKDLHSINFEYYDGDGNSHKVELDNTQLYRLQRRYTDERNFELENEFNDDGRSLPKSE